MARAGAAVDAGRPQLLSTKPVSCSLAAHGLPTRAGSALIPGLRALLRGLVGRLRSVHAIGIGGRLEVHQFDLKHEVGIRRDRP